ncbi:MAG TPA: ABC transporter permease subunit [Candidatus Rifleibacterium sp.]|nr:ABC transporter permease subunit [Candidatus Rifleibacterium sp.]
MKFTLHENFFGIRTGVKLVDQILLGIIPIFLILLIWVLATSGKAITVTLPEGTFEGFEKAPPPDGTRFPERVSLFIDQSRLEYAGEKDEDQQTRLIKAGESFKLGNMPARVFGKGVRITLPPGRIVGREKIAPPPAAAEKKPEQTKALDSQMPAGASLSENISQPVSETTPNIGHTPTTVAGEAQATADKPAAPDTAAADTPAVPATPKFMYRYEVVETRIISPSVLPSPGEVSRSFPSLWSNRYLPKNILYSFLRVGAGFIVAFIVVFPMALLMGTFSKCKAIVAPLMLFGGYLPIPALVPLFMILFGTNELQKVMFLAFGFAIYLLPLFVKSLEEVDNVYLQTGYTLGANKFQVLNNILLPVALPNIFDAMRLGFGIGWGYIILAEMVDMGSFGVGTLILTSQRRGPREDIYLVLIAIVLMAFITDKIWDKVGQQLFPYRSQKR